MGSDPEYTGPALVGVNPSWPIMTLENICDDIFDCPHSTPRLSNDGYYMVRTQDIRKGFYDTQNSVKVSNESYIQRTKRAKPQHGDILLSREGTYFGDAAEVPKDIQLCLGQRIVLLRPCQEQINPTFLRIWMNSKNFQNYLLAFRDGTVAERLNLSTIRKLPIPVPSLEVQAQVISFITPLEGKETLNRRMNATLEGMAQALFKSWFVDFDPVIDNALAAGNPIPEELADRAEVRRKALAESSANREAAKQFPVAFRFTEEMGWIPKGWEVKALDEIADYRNGLALQKFRPNPGESPLPIVRIAQLKNGEATWDEVASPSIAPECIIHDGDVVFSWSGSLMIDLWCGGKAALNQHLFKVTSTDFPKWFYLNWSNEHLHNFQRIAADKAVTMGHIKRSHLSEADCAIPDSTLLTIGSKIINPYIEIIVNQRLQNRTLTNLRDTLLPKLISGELRIPDADKLTEEALV